MVKVNLKGNPIGSSLVAKIQHFYFRGPGSIPSQGMDITCHVVRQKQ